MRITNINVGLKWVGLYLLANLIGGLVTALLLGEGPVVNSSVVAAGIFACMIVIAWWRRRVGRLHEAKEVDSE